MASTLNLVPFPQSELQRSLSEESFGIKSFEFVNVSELEATANVVLLEGNTIQISLTSRGYQVSGHITMSASCQATITVFTSRMTPKVESSKLWRICYKQRVQCMELCDSAFSWRSCPFWLARNEKVEGTFLVK